MTDHESMLHAATKNDAGAWFETHGKIWPKDRDTGLVTPRENYLQQKIQRAINRMEELGLPVRIIGLKPRQKGSTTFFSAVDYCHLRRQPSSAVVIGGQYTQTDAIWEMMQTYCANDTFDWGNTGEINSKEGRWTNGSRLKKETAGDALAGISGTYQVLHATEVARWSKYGVSNAAGVLTNILKCVPLLPDTMVVLESTAEGACYDDQTEILTDSGWKLFKDLTGKEAILTKDPVSGAAYYQPEWKPQIHRYTGPMVHFETRTTNIVVTPNHMMWMARQKAKFKFSRADSVVGNTTDYVFDRAMRWSRSGLKSVTIPEYSHIQGNGTRTHEAKIIPIDIWIKFLGHWLSDGHVILQPGSKNVVLTQVKFVEKFRESMRAVALCMGCKMKEFAHGKGRRFILNNAQLASYLNNYAKPKRIPRDLLNQLSSAQCRDLILSIYEGDGDQNRRNNYKIDRGTIYAGIDKQFQDDIQEISLKAGYASSAFGPERNRRVTFTSSTRAMVRHDNPPVVRQGYDGLVYCVTLPFHHLLMVRRKGIATWCGNSGTFYERWLGAVDAEDFLAGKVDVQPGKFVRVFAPWYEFADSTMRLSDQQKREIQRTLDTDEEYQGEQALIDRYGRDDNGMTRLGNSVTDYDVWEQLAWRRFAIHEECQRDKVIFDRDYPHSWQDAFVKSGNLRFNSTGLSVLRKRIGLRVPIPGIFEEASNRRLGFRQTDRNEAQVILFEKPTQGKKYLLSVDPMTGATQVAGEDPDYHGVFMLRAGYFDTQGRWEKPVTAARIVPCRWDIDVLENVIWQLARYYGPSYGCKIVIEMNMDRGLTELLKQRSANLYQRQMFNQREQKIMPALGFQTNAKTRENLIETLAKAIREWDAAGQGIDIFDDHAIEQLENFVKDEKGFSKASEGFHDDDVLSIALGLHLIEHATPFYPERQNNNLPPDLREMMPGSGAVGGAYS